MRFKLTSLLLFLITSLSFGQNKLFYDVEEKGTNEDNASYYRIVSGDTAKDYFMSGEVYGIGTAIKVDPKDDAKTIWRGKRTCYYKMGVTRSVDFYNKDGKRDSVSTHYYESGKIEQRMHCRNGIVVEKFYDEWDEFGNREKIFRDQFDKGNSYDWPLNTNAKHSCRIVKDSGLYMETYTTNGIAQAINLPMDQLQNYSIETSVGFLGGHRDVWHGLIWGFKDWDNYCFLFICASGNYSTGAMVDGMIHFTVKDQYSSKINTGRDYNQLRVVKEKNKISFSINGFIVDVETPFTVTDKVLHASASGIGYADGGGGLGVAGGVGTIRTRQVTRKYVVDRELMYTLKGNYTGFMLDEDETQQCIFKNIIVHQYLNKSDTSFGNGASTSPGAPGNEFEGWHGEGSGFFIDPRGYVVTNYHVVKDAKLVQIDIVVDGARKAYKGDIVSTDKENDIAVLKINDTIFKPFKTLPYNLKTESADVATDVFTIGFPQADKLGIEAKFTDGKISSKTGFKGALQWYQISVPVQHGNSGGPLFDLDGNIVGLVNAGIPGDQNVNYAIKSAYLKIFLDAIPTKFSLPSDNSLANKALTEKIKVLTNYMVMILVK
jgi:S1-C subfamily serine protease/antitoxin component YwqK of YwqJK toxin-antitoxin module